MAHPEQELPVVVIGAGVAGLASAMLLAARGQSVQVYEAAGAPGGKMREVHVGRASVDAGPTVLTMRWVFEELFADAGDALDNHVELQPLEILARHSWADGSRLDLYAEHQRSVDAIAAFAGHAQARHYEQFCVRARRSYEVLEPAFLRQARPGMRHFMHPRTLQKLPSLWRSAPFSSLWRALSEHFPDPRLQQLFGRYATYCGSSPFLAPATLMLIAHVEQQGVWTVKGGMHQIARAMEAQARRQGVEFHYGQAVVDVLMKHDRACGVRLANGLEIKAAAVIVNADPGSLAEGKLGQAMAQRMKGVDVSRRSLSAITWCLETRAEGFPLSRHNVFFSQDYAREFSELQQKRCLPTDPTIYLCAQDRADDSAPLDPAHERLFVLVNAPPGGRTDLISDDAIAKCETSTFDTLARHGVRIDRVAGSCIRTTPADFAGLFPGTGGALYGQATHGWRASFTRPGARTAVPGLFLAGGGVHPGAGVPMAVISGRFAARSAIEELSRAGRLQRRKYL
jgi:1-hydroxycarotenoid 3,4-desaturase